MELTPKKKFFAEMYVKGQKFVEIAETLGVTRQALFMWKKDEAVQTYMEQYRKDNTPIGLDEIENWSPLKISMLRRKLDEVEREMDPIKNLPGLLRRKLRKIREEAGDNEEGQEQQRELFDEIINIFAEYGIQPREKVMTIFIRGILADTAAVQYAKDCLAFTRWLEENKIIPPPDEWKIIADIFFNAEAALTMERIEDVEP